MGRRLFATILALALLLQAGSLLAATHDQDYREAQFVWVSLGAANVETGISLMPGFWDGLTEAVPDGGARKTLLNSTPRPTPTDPEEKPDKGRYFYFDVHDSYIKGGKNSIVLTVTYLDVGLTPVYLDYDSMDETRPDSTVRSVTHKRIAIATRQNTESWVTRRIEIEDARLANMLNGADFRIGAETDLTLRNVALLLVHHEEPTPPIRVFLVDREIKFDVYPVIDAKTSRTLVPMRAIFEALGASVQWDGATRSVTAVKSQTTIVLTIDSPWGTVNGQFAALDQPPLIVSERTVVPLRFVSEQLGLDVSWDGATRTITLTPRPAQLEQPAELEKP